MAPDAIDLVLTTGGSSRILAFRRMLSEALPRARLQESDLFTSVASGLAVSAALQTGGAFSSEAFKKTLLKTAPKTLDFMRGVLYDRALKLADGRENISHSADVYPNHKAQTFH